jgi:hypothetical protein
VHGTDPERRVPRAAQGDGGAGLRPAGAGDGRGRERPFCADVSRADEEPLAATASQVDRWLLVEYRGLWAHDAVDGSTLSPDLKRALVAWRNSEPRSRVLFVRRTDRRSRDGLLAYRVTSREEGSWARRLELDRHDDLVGLDLDRAGDPVDHPLLLVCTHGKHDACCARHGRPLYEALREQVDDDWAWQCSHVGGDRFAGNLVVLPSGLYLGRVEPREVWETIDELLAGRIPLSRYRGRSCHPFPAQAAERAIREATGLAGLDDLRLASFENAGAGWRVSFETAPGETWSVDVERREGPLTYLTCSARELRHPRHYAAGSPPERVA